MIFVCTQYLNLIFYLQSTFGMEKVDTKNLIQNKSRKCFCFVQKKEKRVNVTLNRCPSLTSSA
jgi:hypothetical protein